MSCEHEYRFAEHYQEGSSEYGYYAFFCIHCLELREKDAGVIDG